MSDKETTRIYLQYFFFISIVVTIITLYVLQKEKSQGGGSRFFPQLNSKQKRTDYYPDGKIRATGTIYGFEKDGRWTYYDTTGNVVLIEVYEKGKLVSSEKND